MASEPSGTVTFLFTDIEGSTRLLAAHGEVYQLILLRHRELIGGSISTHGGEIVDSPGEELFAVFGNAIEAVVATVEAQRSLAAEPWPSDVVLRVRMGLHTGSAERVDGGYVGLDVHRAARIVSAAHGGQILVSRTTAALVQSNLPPEIALRDLGPHRLKDLARPDTIFQIEAPGLATLFPPLATLDSRPHNLPLQPTALIGRTAELQKCRALLESTRLLTLTGPGGSGKTRLALQVAAEILEEFHDGVFFVSLAEIADAANVPDAIATALSVTSNPERDRIQSIAHYLKDLRLLLIMDNFEHVVEAAPVVSTLLEHAPGLKVLVTSREPLRLVQEQEFPVPPLVLPAPGDEDSLAAFASCEALQLFVERAQAVDPEFRLTSRNAATIAEICVRLDGLPLAIELAAARMKLFSAQQLLDRLKERFKVLAGGRRNMPERQQTLRKTVDWSYRFLSTEEKTLFGRLAVFVGGFTLESAEAVCASPLLKPLSIDVAGGIESLLNKSLLGRQVSDSDDAPRFRMLETIREYAVELLDQDPQATLVRNAHASFFAEFTIEFNESFWNEEGGRADAVGWIHRVAADYDNIRSAVEWSISAGEMRDAFRIVGGLRIFSFDQGYIREASGWVGQLAGRGEGVEPRYRAFVHVVAGMIAGATGNQRQAELEFERALELAREAGDVRLEAFAALQIAYGLIHDQKRHKEMEQRIQLAADLFRKAGCRPGLAITCAALGEVYYLQGRYEEALAKYRESLATNPRDDNHGILAAIGFALWRLGRPDEAKEIFRQVLIQEREGTRSRRMVSHGLLGLAAVAEDVQRAARLLAASDALLGVEQIVPDPTVQMEIDAVRDRIAVSIDEESFDTLCTEARNSDIAAAIAYALEEPEGPVARGD